MPGSNAIRYLKNEEIDKNKWDHCIHSSSNPLIYAYSFYLDHMAKNWDGLVFEDYEFIMPLPWKTKFGIKYIYQPFLSAQLGVFGAKPSESLISSFIEAIPSSFRLVEISLNSSNHQVSHPNIRRRKNYVLDLSKTYSVLSAGYSENSKRNLKKALSLGCTAVRNVRVETIIQLAVEQMKHREKGSAENIDRFRKLFDFLQSKGMAATYGIEQAGQVIASAVFFIDSRRAYYLLVGNHPDGRGLGASHLLVDTFIKDHAGKDMVLDFEGSDIDTLALYYKSFGAINEPYPFLNINRLPFFLNWLRK